MDHDLDCKIEETTEKIEETAELDCMLKAIIILSEEAHNNNTHLTDICHKLFGGAPDYSPSEDFKVKDSLEKAGIVGEIHTNLSILRSHIRRNHELVQALRSL